MLNRLEAITEKNLNIGFCLFVTPAHLKHMRHIFTQVLEGAIVLAIQEALPDHIVSEVLRGLTKEVLLIIVRSCNVLL